MIRFSVKDSNIHISGLCYDSGGRAIFSAYTDLFKGYIDETGGWIFHQSAFESLGYTD